MLYMVEKIFLYGISFNILVVYNESGHKIPFFPQSSRKNINIFKPKMEGHEQAQCCHTHISIKVGPFKFRLLVSAQHNW